MAKELPISLTAAQCKGRTFIVSGANAGIGYEVAKHLVTLGTNRVIMAVRNMESGKAAKEDIENETGRKTVLQVWHLDLAEYASVEAFAKRASSELDRVDGLVANAGIANGSWAEYEGNEANITVNLISTLLLAVLMLPKLEQTAVDDKAAAPMITFVGTVNAFQVQSSLGKIDRSKDIISDLNDREKWEMDIVNRCVLQPYTCRLKTIVHAEAPRSLTRPLQIRVVEAFATLRRPPPGGSSTCVTDRCHHQPCPPRHVQDGPHAQHEPRSALHRRRNQDALRPHRRSGQQGRALRHGGWRTKPRQIPC